MIVQRRLGIASPGFTNSKGFYGLVSGSPLLEIARVLMRFNHVARCIVNANHRIVVMRL